MASNSKAREGTTLEAMVVQNRTDIALLRALIRDREGFTSTESRSIGLAGGTTQAGITGFLKSAGDTMIGPIAYLPKLTFLNTEDSSIDISQERGENFTSHVQLSVGPSPLNLDWIHGALHAGQQLEIQGILTESFVIRESVDDSMSAVGDGSTSIITVTADTTKLASGEYVSILGAGEFTIPLAKITIVDSNTFTYDLGVIGSTTPDAGFYFRGNIRTHLGDDVTVADNQLYGLTYDSATSEWVIKGAEGSTGGGGGDLSEPIELGVNEVVTQIPPTKTIVKGDIFNPAHITLDKSIDIQLDISGTSNKYKSIFIIFDTTGGGNTVTWPVTVNNPPVIKDSKVERISVHLFTINNGVLWTFATTVGSSTLGLQNLSELNIDVNKDWEAQGINNFGPITGVTNITMTGVLADIADINQIAMTGATPKIIGIEEIDFDGATSKIQGIHNIEFNLANNSIDDLSTDGVNYNVDELQRHQFQTPNGIFLVLDEVSVNDRRIDVQQNRITNIGKLSFTGTFDLHTAGFSEIFQDLTDENIRYISKNAHIFEVDGQTQPLLTIGNFVGLGGYLQDIAVLNLTSVNTDPTLNGEFQMNGIDVKVLSGGIVRNLSDITPGGALLPDLSNMTSPTLPTVNLSLNGNNLDGVKSIIGNGVGDITEFAGIKFTNDTFIAVSGIESMSISVLDLGKIGFSASSIIAEFVETSAGVFKLDMLSHGITNALYIESNTNLRPGSGFIRMAQLDQIRMRNVGDTDDVFIQSGTNSQGNDAILFDVAGAVQFSISDFDIDVVQSDIINTGDVLPSGVGGEVGDSTNFYNQMHSQFFVPEGATPISDRFGLSKTGNVVYLNFDDNHTDAGIGIFEQGVRHFLFSRTGDTPFINEFAIAGTGALAGEEYKIQMGNQGDNNASISLIEGDTFDLIINRAFSGTTPQTTGVDLRANGLTTLLTNNIESKFFSNVNVNSNNIDGVKNVFADASGLGTIGELSGNGGFDYYVRDRITWDLNDETFIQMDVVGIGVISDGAISITSADTMTIESSDTMQLSAIASTGINFLVGSVLKTTIQDNALILQPGVDLFLQENFMEFTEITIPLNPVPDHGRLYATDIGGITTPVWLDNNGVESSLLGAGSLNTNLSNLTAPTVPTVDLSLNGNDLLGVVNITMDSQASTINDIGSIIMGTAGGVINNIEELFFLESNQVISSQVTGLLYNVPENQRHEFEVGSTQVLFIEEVADVFQLNLNGYTALGVKDIRFDSTAIYNIPSNVHGIGADSDRILFNIPAGDFYEFRVNNDDVLKVDKNEFTSKSKHTTFGTDEEFGTINLGVNGLETTTINIGAIGLDRVNFIAALATPILYLNGITQIFNPHVDFAGVNVGFVTNDPTTTNKGDMWYIVSTEKFRINQNGVNMDMIGANTTLTNLVDVVKPNKHILADRTDFVNTGNLGAHNSSDAFFNVFTDRISFPNQATLPPTQLVIQNFSDSMIFNVPSNTEFAFMVNGAETVTIDNDALTLQTTDLILVNSDILMNQGTINQLNSIIFGNNFTLAANFGSTSMGIDSLNSTDIFTLRQGGNVRFSYDSLGKVIVSGGTTGGTFMSINNASFDILAAANGTDTELSCQSNTSIVFRGNTTEVGRYDDQDRDWIFSPSSDILLEAGNNIALSPLNGVIFVNANLDIIGPATIDFSLSLGQSTVGSAGVADIVPNRPATYINIKFGGLDLVIPAFAI